MLPVISGKALRSRSTWEISVNESQEWSKVWGAHLQRFNLLKHLRLFIIAWYGDAHGKAFAACVCHESTHQWVTLCVVNRWLFIIRSNFLSLPNFTTVYVQLSFAFSYRSHGSTIYHGQRQANNAEHWFFHGEVDWIHRTDWDGQFSAFRRSVFLLLFFHHHTAEQTFVKVTFGSIAREHFH